ncbi:MAG: DHA2 family efflux MFS transporter permease subunit [Candidatus Binataceae bacterium]|jgi:DHA2 family multidrug resistance protein
MESSPTAAAAQVQVSHATDAARKWIIAIAVILCTILEVLDSSIVNVALPHMQGSFSASVDEIAWVVTTYLVAAGIMIPTTGWIAGQFGRKRYFLISITTFIISSAMCGAAQSLDQMVAFRFLQGIAGAALQPLSQAILMETFPPNEQTLAMAVWGLGLMVAPIMGPTVGGYITDNFNWRWNFYINIPIGIAAAFMVSTFVHDPSFLTKLKGRGRADWIGIVTLVLALGLGEIVMDRGDRADWFATPWVWYFSLIAGGSFVILVWHEWNTPEPIVQVRILKNMNFTIPTIMLIIMTFVMYGMQILNPIFLQDLLGYTPYKAGLAMAPRGLGVMASMFFLGGIAKRGYDTRPLVALGFLAVAGACWTMGALDLNMAMSNFIKPTIVQGVGVGLIFPNLSASALGSIPREQIGYAASLYSMTRNVGASIGTSVLTTILVHREQVQQSQLVQHLSVFDAWRMSDSTASMPGAIHFNYAGQLVTGQKQGLAMIYGTMQGQAMMLALNSIYRMLAFIMLGASLLCFLLPRPRGKAPAGAH